MDPIFQRCHEEAQRICAASPRIQKSGDIAYWENSLASQREFQIKRLESFPVSQQIKIMNFKLKGRIQMEFPPENLPDFLQSFYLECLRAFRREFKLPGYSPKSRRENAEFFAYCDRYSQRKILGGIALIRRRAIDFLQSLPQEIPCEIEGAVQYCEESRSWGGKIYKAYLAAAQEKEREKLAAGDREEMIAALFQFLEAKGRCDCIRYLSLILEDWHPAAIDAELGITRRERDYLQQRLRYWILKFQEREARRGGKGG
jgi:hypothetical protein